MSSNDYRTLPMPALRIRGMTLVSLPETLGDDALMPSINVSLFPPLPTIAQLVRELFMTTTAWYAGHRSIAMPPAITSLLLEMQRGARCETCDHAALLVHAVEGIGKSSASTGLDVWLCLERCQQCLLRRR